MPNTTKSNKLKRKRGKKFVWRGSRDVNDLNNAKQEVLAATSGENPFENHSKSKRVAKDLDKRQELLTEYRRLNKNSVIKDHRIGEQSSKLSEEDKMKLRYMKEQRDRAREALKNQDDEMEERKAGGGGLSTKTSRKRTKFQLDSESDDNGDVFMGFTHKGKVLGEGRDDFNEEISNDSDDDKHDRSKRKGFLGQEVVEQMHFGGGEDQEQEGGEMMDGEKKKKKTRNEVFQEIMEKSKSYD